MFGSFSSSPLSFPGLRNKLISFIPASLPSTPVQKKEEPFLTCSMIQGITISNSFSSTGTLELVEDYEGELVVSLLKDTGADLKLVSSSFVATNKLDYLSVLLPVSLYGSTLRLVPGHLT